MRLKALIATGVVCTVSFAAAGPVHAKSDNGHGKAQRCQAAKNGKHNGFTCETEGGTIDLICPSGYSVFPSRFDLAADTNGNGFICRSAATSTDDFGI